MEKSIFFDTTLYAYLLAAILYSFWLLQNHRIVGYAGTLCLFLGWLTHAIFIVRRSLIAGYPPFSNSFETLVFFSWLIVLQYFVVATRFRLRFLGSGSSFLALVILAYSTLFPSAVRPLMPALQNGFWLTVHVILCFISYTTFTLAFVIAILHLIRQRGWHQWLAMFVAAFFITGLGGGMLLHYLHKTGTIVLVWSWITGIQCGFAFVILSMLLWFVLFGLVQQKTWKTEETSWENFVYKAIAFGFPFLTMGIVSGSVWANEAWGSYWQWDPKETWSLITWLIYAIYLHVRYVKGWHGVSLSWFAVIGFLAVLFTYFGVNYLLSGLHSYA